MSELTRQTTHTTVVETDRNSINVQPEPKTDRFDLTNNPQFNIFREMMLLSPWNAPTCSLRDISAFSGSLRIRTIGAVPPGVLRGRRGQEFERDTTINICMMSLQNSWEETGRSSSRLTSPVHFNVLRRLQTVLTVDSTTVRGRQTHTNISKEPFCSVGWKLLTRHRVLQRGSVFWGSGSD